MRFLNKILHHTYKPLLERYLQKDRNYSFRKMHLNIYKDVFHPGFFYSTKYLVSFLEKLSLKGKTFLEVGCGSGLISIFAARQGAEVTALDINPLAVKCTEENARRNKADINVMLSDLFESVTAKSFDLVIITPPYFKKDPENYAGHAWYAGKNLEYFYKLFAGLHKVNSSDSRNYMVLAENCDLQSIRSIGAGYGYSMEIVSQKKIMFESNYIFEIVKC